MTNEMVFNVTERTARWKSCPPRSVPGVDIIESVSLQYHVAGSAGVQDNDPVEELRVVRKAVPQKRFEALAHIRGDRLSPQLLP